MKKLVINGLIILVCAVIAFAVIFNIYRLFSVSMIDEEVAASLETEEPLAEEKIIVEETAVKVSVSNATKTTTSTSKATPSKNTTTNTSDEDVSEFLSSLE